MRIAVDAELEREAGGVGVFARQIIEALRRTPEMEVVLVRASGWGPFKWWKMYRAIRAARVDVWWQLGGWVPFFLPRSIAVIQTVHDVISFLHPEWFPSTFVARAWSHKVRVPWALWRADVIHAVSHWTAGEVAQLFPWTQKKITTAYQGVGEVSEGGRVPVEIGRPYVLCIGSVEPRKNIPMLCRSFDSFAKEYPDPHLVFVTSGGWKQTESWQAIEEVSARHAGRVHVLFGVTDEDRWALTRQAGVVVQLSFAEGFGRPVAEALSVGTPTVVAANSALQEIARDAAILVHATDEKKITRALWRALYHPTLPDTLRRLGRERAKQFDDHHMIRTVLDRLDEPHHQSNKHGLSG